ncbi:MAG: hypothetical protein HYZ72_04365 [Deltaproteobacteria bacterium]|nr:hypothetical protein [Deltaproteobacteria bacterium]
MTDRTHAGVRCYTLRPIRAVKGDLPRGSYGTVMHAMDNLGRRFILVRWDNGITVSVFPDEIELERQDDGHPY